MIMKTQFSISNECFRRCFSESYMWLGNVHRQKSFMWRRFYFSRCFSSGYIISYLEKHES